MADAHHLKTARSVFGLRLGKCAHGLLAMRAVREDEDQRHRFALELADGHLLAVGQMNGEFGGSLARQRAGDREQRERRAGPRPREMFGGAFASVYRRG